MPSYESLCTSVLLTAKEDAALFDNVSPEQFELWIQMELKDVQHRIAKRKPVPQHALKKYIEPEPVETPISDKLIKFILSKQSF